MEWITCENTYEESWRRLMEYANVELAIQAIESIHGAATKSTLINYKKQAEQVRVSLLQAKEYFEAARSSSLFTQPNHLYYGTIALSTACMLIRGDGTKSLDYLRNDPKNGHHGLDFTFSSDLKRSKDGVNLLDNSYIKICKNGHFSNWYSTLLTKQPVGALHQEVSPDGNSTNLITVGSFEIPEFPEIENVKKTLLFLIKRLPDLHLDLHRYGILLDYARGEQLSRSYMESQEHESIFTFHNSPSYETLMAISEKFTSDESMYFSINIKEGATSGVIKTKRGNLNSFSYPDSRDTLDHKTIYYKDSVNTPEIVDLYLVSYALSMLSRYYPDIWISFLESHCKGAKLVERIVRILMLKTPNLMLNQICGRNHIISTHRPFWH